MKRTKDEQRKNTLRSENEARETQLRTKDEQKGTELRSPSEAREILFTERPDIKELFDTIEALPEDKQGDVIRILTDAFTKVTPEMSEAQFRLILEGTRPQLRKAIK